MGYGKRIDTLCSLLERAKVFADVGCDHGYCSEYMLKNSLCTRLIFSDVSKGSLSKAEKLLKEYILSGRAKGVLGDGFYGLKKSADEVLIAGMGGREIVKILSDEAYGYLPEKFLFQPMSDTELVRRYLIEHGGKIERDFTFEDGKYYDVLKGGKRAVGEPPQAYTDAEYKYGKENLERLPSAFIERTKKQIKRLKTHLNTETNERGKEVLEEKIEELEAVLK